MERTISTTEKRVALTYNAAMALQLGIEAAAFNDAENETTTGRIYEDNRVVGSYTQEFTIEETEEELVKFVAGEPDVAGD